MSFSIVRRASKTTNAQATEYPWKESEDTYNRTIAQVREFLQAHGTS